MAESNEDEAPLSLTTRSDQPNEDHYHHDPTKHLHSRSRTKLILCCGFIASLTLLIAVTFIVLSLTVFHLRNPNLTVDSITLIQPLDFVNGKVNTSKNATFSVEISLRNPNAASFRVRNATLLLCCGDELVLVGESIRTTETIPAKRTIKMNLTAEIVTTKLLSSVPSLMEDLRGKGIDLRSTVIIGGKAKIIKIFKKSVHLKTVCSMKITNNSTKLTFQCFRIGHDYKHVQI